MDIGKAIRTLRQQRGMSQTELARRCFSSTNSISRLETGKAFPPKHTMEQICRALDVTVAHLILESLEEHDLPEKDRQLHVAMLNQMRQDLLTKE